MKNKYSYVYKNEGCRAILNVTLRGLDSVGDGEREAVEKYIEAHISALSREAEELCQRHTEGIYHIIYHVDIGCADKGVTLAHTLKILHGQSLLKKKEWKTGYNSKNNLFHAIKK